MRIVPGSLVAAVFVLVLGPGARVDGQTLRPLETESATLLPSGSTQISLGTTYLRNRRFPAFTAPDFLNSQDLVTAPEVEVRIGAGNWVEFQLRYELLSLDESRSDGTKSNQFGGGDAEIFTKIRVLREGDRMPAVAAMFRIKLPNANRVDRLGTDETDFGLSILASKAIGPVTAHVNLGIQILGNPACSTATSKNRDRVRMIPSPGRWPLSRSQSCNSTREPIRSAPWRRSAGGKDRASTTTSRHSTAACRSPDPPGRCTEEPAPAWRERPKTTACASG